MPPAKNGNWKPSAGPTKLTSGDEKMRPSERRILTSLYPCPVSRDGGISYYIWGHFGLFFCTSAEMALLHSEGETVVCYQSTHYCHSVPKSVGAEGDFWYFPLSETHINSTNWLTRHSFHGFPGLFTDTSEHIRFYSIVFYFLVFRSPQLLFLAVD